MDFHYTFSALVAARALLAFAPLPDALKYSQQLSSPLTSYARLKEGVYLFSHGIDPYSGGLFRHSPLLLSAFTTLLPLKDPISKLLWTACDAAAAWSLVKIWRLRQRVGKSSRDGLIAALYLLNPYLFLPSLALSTSSLENTALLVAVAFACERRSSASILLLAILTHLSFSSIIYILPIFLLLTSSPVSNLASPRPFALDFKGLRKAVLPLVGEYFAYTTVLTAASTLVCGGSRAWVEKTWGSFFLLPDLTPNPGLWWYFFTEMFDHFRPFFLMVFSLHLLIYVLPITIKFQHDLLYATFLMAGVSATFKPYPTLSDPGLFLSLWSLFPETYSYLRHPIVTALIHLHGSLLLPLFNHLWLATGTGNANFFYASTLVFGIANGAGLIDAIWAGLATAIPVKDGDWDVGQE
ncbi:PIG-U-domain-containing protein [Irpex rosettiformis]|uniref:PIG-U-domain-containing protein n=1 Tax=Irpex rosettiformis TaxID=378272 RepID=A0ACB8U165_9APHY|nr:PIG-U-domain-containing protein [Irpex rosettiformis]